MMRLRPRPRSLAEARQVYAVIHSNPGLKLQQVANRVELPRGTVENRLMALEWSGLGWFVYEDDEGRLYPFSSGCPLVPNSMASILGG